MSKFQYVLFLLLQPVFVFSQNQASADRAIVIADSVIEVMGGQKNWDEVHCLRWDFFGRRTLYWDKWTGDVRIEIPSQKLLILTNLSTKKGSVYRDNHELMQEDSIAYFMERGYKIWANDSYWLIMPFKLRDQGVKLVYLGTANDASGIPCLKLELTFDNVGVTPDNKYHVYVNPKSYLVTQWDYFEKYTDENPSISNPWDNYLWYGKILLSDDRGTVRGKLANIAVQEQFREGLFERP